MNLRRSVVRRSVAALALALAIAVPTVASQPAVEADPGDPACYVGRGQPITRYGKTGWMKCGTNVGYASVPGGLEYFVVAPNRTIWHIWPASGGWREMPGGGRADNIAKAFNCGSGRIVWVNVNGHPNYATEVYPGENWRPWVLQSQLGGRSC